MVSWPKTRIKSLTLASEGGKVSVWSNFGEKLLQEIYTPHILKIGEENLAALELDKVGPRSCRRIHGFVFRLL